MQLPIDWNIILICQANNIGGYVENQFIHFPYFDESRLSRFFSWHSSIAGALVTVQIRLQNDAERTRVAFDSKHINIFLWKFPSIPFLWNAYCASFVISACKNRKLTIFLPSYFLRSSFLPLVQTFFVTVFVFNYRFFFFASIESTENSLLRTSIQF